MQFIGLLSILGIIIGVSGLIYAAIKKKPKKKWAVGSVICFIIMTLAIAMSPPPASKGTAVDATSKQVDKKSPESQKETIHTIGLTPDQFKEKFNLASKESNSGLLINELKIETGDKQNAFKYTFTQNLALVGTINKSDGTVRDISLIAQPTKNSSQNANILISFGLLIQAVNPELQNNERGQILKDLGFMDKDADLTKLDKRIIRGNKEYHASFVSGMGFLFNVKDIDDK